MSTAADLSLESLEQRDDVVIARLEGEIDRSNAQQLTDALLQAVPNMALALVLDLSDTTYIDSSGVHLLFDASDRLSKRQQQLRVVLPDGARISKLLSVVSMDRTVPLHSTVEEAVAASRQGDDAG